MAANTTVRGAYDAAEVAEILGISKRLVYEGAKDGSLPSLKIGSKRVVFPKIAISRLLEGQQPGDAS